MRAFRIARPSAFAAVMAGLVSVLVFGAIAGGVFATAEDIYMRVAFSAATCLLTFDVIEGAYVARLKGRGIADPHLWVHAFYLGYGFTVLMVLMNWESMATAGEVFAANALGGAIVGAVVAYAARVLRITPLEDRYDLSRPVTSKLLGRVYFLWPLIVTGVIAAFLAYPPEAGFGPGFFLFQVIFLGTLIPLYGFREEHFWTGFWPRALGLGLLFIGLLWL